MSTRDLKIDSNHEVSDPFMLSYHQTSMLDKDGRIISKEKKRAMREKEGYCLTCPGVPSKLFDIKKSRLNPLWAQKKPRTKDGESLNGWCVKCNPALNAHAKRENSSRKLKTEPSESTRSVSPTNGSTGLESSPSNSPKVATTRTLQTSPPSTNGSPSLPTRIVVRNSNEMRGPASAGRAQANQSTRYRRPSTKVPNATVLKQHSAGSVGVSTHSTDSGRASLTGSSVSSSQHAPAMERTRSRRSCLEREISSLSMDSPLDIVPEPDRPSQYSNGQPQARCQRNAHAKRRPNPRSLDRRSSHRSNVSMENHLQSQSNHSRGGGLSRSCHSARSLDDNNSNHSASSFRAMDHSGSGSGEMHRRNSFTRRRGTMNPTYLSREQKQRAANGRGSSQRSLDSCNSEDDFSSMPSRSAADQEQAKALVNNVTKLLEDMKAIGDPEVLTDIIVSSMNSHPHTPEIQSLCIQAISDLYREPSVDCTSLFTSSGHKSIIQAMKNFPSSLQVQEKSLEALCILSSREDTRRVLIRSDVCSPIDHALHRFLAEESLISFAVNAMRSLSCEREGAIAMEKLRTSQKVVEVMHCNMMSPTIQRDGCSLLSNLHVDTASQQVSRVDSSIFQVVEAAMRTHPSDASIQESACFSLKNLTYEENNLRMLARMENIINLLLKAQEFESDAAADAMVVIERIQVSLAEDQSMEDHISQKLRSLIENSTDQPELVSEIMETVQKYQWSERTVYECIEMLFGLVVSSEAHRKKLAEVDYIRRLEMCTKSSHLSRNLRAETVKLIGMISSSN